MARQGPIVLFCADLGANGVSRNTVYLANFLTEQGRSVKIIALAGGQFERHLRGPELILLGRNASWRPAALALAVPALRLELQALDPSVVVSMGNHAHLCVWSALSALPQAPRVYRISNDPQHAGEPGFGAVFRRLGLQIIAADGDRLLCVSDSLARQDALAAAVRQGRVIAINNGVDVAHIKSNVGQPVAHPWIAQGLPYIIAVGRVHRQKNYNTLIDALAEVRARGADLRLMILGGGSSRAVQKLMKHARRAGVDHFVNLLGVVENPAPFVNAASAFVLLSRWEGASNALLEALACGAPIVASRTAGNAREVLKDGAYGRLVDPDDVQETAGAILQQITAPARILPGRRAEDYTLDKTLLHVATTLIALCPRDSDESQMIQPSAQYSEPLKKVAGAN